eukprot:1329807-Amorphochlora_amoeboformis.AAC.2
MSSYTLSPSSSILPPSVEHGEKKKPEESISSLFLHPYPLPPYVARNSDLHPAISSPLSAASFLINLVFAPD